jgi:hypothetical protein
MAVTPFPLSARTARELIREVAGDSRRYTIPSPPVGGEWYRLVTRRQVELCLREGDVIGEPQIDATTGAVLVTMERFSAGVLVRIGVVIWRSDNENWRVTVKTVEQRP